LLSADFSGFDFVERYRWALLVLVVAGLSAGIDGLLARG